MLHYCQRYARTHTEKQDLRLSVITSCEHGTVACFSPALVDVDAVYFVGTYGDLGQGLDDMVALQNHVTL